MELGMMFLENLWFYGSMYLDGIYKYGDKIDNEWFARIDNVTVDLTNNTISEISSEKLKHNSIIHTMSHFAKNYKELKSDEEVISREYEMIRGFVVDLMRDTKNNSDKLMVDIINDTIDIFKSFSENIGLY